MPRRGDRMEIMKAVVFYESAPDVATQAPAHQPAHRARWHEFSRRGELLMIGPFANAQDDGAMGVFTSRAAAEEFVRGDPFVLGGVVRKWTILDWNEVLVPDAPGTLPGAGGARGSASAAIPSCWAASSASGPSSTGTRSWSRTPRGPYPARAGGLWLRRTLVLSRFHAMVVPSGWRTRVQPIWWIMT